MAKQATPQTVVHPAVIDPIRNLSGLYRVEPRDLRSLWPVLWESVRQSHPPTTKTDVLAERVWQALLDGTLDGWVGTDRDGHAAMVGTTQLIHDHFSGDHSLLIYSLWGPMRTSAELSQLFLAQLLQYALRAGCRQLVGYVSDDNDLIRRLVARAGLTMTEYRLFQVDVIDEKLEAKLQVALNEWADRQLESEAQDGR